MKLTAEELQWISKRIDTYHIIYQKIYDELADHFITAIETARANGDQRNIETVFDEITETQFPGNKAIQKVAVKYVFAYNRKIRKTMQANIRYYLDWRAAGLISILILTGFYLPQTKTTSLIFMFAMTITAFIPSWYAYRKLTKIKSPKGKMSLVKSFVSSRSRNLMLITNMLLIIIGFAARQWHINFLNPIYYHPVFYVVILSFFVIYGLSTMRLCRQELKLADHSG